MPSIKPVFWLISNHRVQETILHWLGDSWELIPDGKHRICCGWRPLQNSPSPTQDSNNKHKSQHFNTPIITVFWILNSKSTRAQCCISKVLLQSRSWPQPPPGVKIIINGIDADTTEQFPCLGSVQIRMNLLKTTSITESRTSTKHMGIYSKESSVILPSSWPAELL